MYFRLNPECYFIKGDYRGAIYDLIEGKVYSLDAEEASLVQDCENNHVLENREPLLDELKERCIGNYYDRKVFMEKLRLGSPIQEFQTGQPPFLHHAFLEINNTCNQACWFCGIHGIHRSMGCMGCNIWDEDGEDLGIEEWKAVVDDLADLKCQSVFLTGGDLTLKWDIVMALLDHTGKKIPQVHVIINGNRYSGTIAGDLAGKAIPIIQTETVPETDNGNRYLLVARGDERIPGKNLPPGVVSIDWISRDFSSLPGDSNLVSKTKLQKTDLFRFSRAKKKHPCLANSLTISWKGEVLPCPMLRGHSLGSVKKQHIYDIFSDNAERIDSFWNLNLEKIRKCHRCEFRFACNDCRALEEALTDDLFGKSLCNYDAAKGIWV